MQAPIGLEDYIRHSRGQVIALTVGSTTADRQHNAQPVRDALSLLSAAQGVPEC